MPFLLLRVHYRCRNKLFNYSTALVYMHDNYLSRVYIHGGSTYRLLWIAAIALCGRPTAECDLISMIHGTSSNAKTPSRVVYHDWQ